MSFINYIVKISEATRNYWGLEITNLRLINELLYYY